jgi:hypothetical protein
MNRPKAYMLPIAAHPNRRFRLKKTQQGVKGFNPSLAPFRGLRWGKGQENFLTG